MDDLSPFQVLTKFFFSTMEIGLDPTHWNLQDQGYFLVRKFLTVSQIECLSRRDTAKVEDHLDDCRRCTAMYLELTEVNSNLAGIIAPLLLGGAAAGYLASSGTAAATGLFALVGHARDAIGANAGAATTAAVAAGVAAVVTAGFLFNIAGEDDVVIGADQPITAIESLSPSTKPPTESPSSTSPEPGDPGRTPNTSPSTIADAAAPIVGVGSPTPSVSGSTTAPGETPSDDPSSGQSDPSTEPSTDPSSPPSPTTGAGPSPTSGASAPSPSETATTASPSPSETATTTSPSPSETATTTSPSPSETVTTVSPPTPTPPTADLSLRAHFTDFEELNGFALLAVRVTGAPPATLQFDLPKAGPVSFLFALFNPCKIDEKQATCDASGDGEFRAWFLVKVPPGRLDKTTLSVTASGFHDPDPSNNIDVPIQ